MKLRLIRQTIVASNAVAILTDAVVIGFVLLLLKQTVNLEPVGSAAVARAALRHADQEAFSQPTGLACRPILLVDDAFAVVLAFGYRR